MRIRHQVLALLLLASTGCAVAPDRDRADDRKKVEDELSGEMSLKADREQLKDMRKEIPQERRKTNDELALYLQLMKQGTEQPENVRDKFTTIVQKKREGFREKVARLRENYHRSEQKRRDEYLEEQKAKRDHFMSSKHKSNETQEFYSDQDRDRQDFFSGERSRRQSFEAEIDSQSKDFDSYMREKNNEFNEQYRIYAKAFSDKEKQKKAAERGEFNQMDQAPAKHLGTED